MIYFDNAATSRFKPNSVIDAMKSALINASNPGRSAHDDALQLSSEIYEVRSSIKSILHANESYEVIFSKNTTEALNVAILGYLANFRYKVHVITTMIEHNSVLRPLKHLASIGKIDVTILPITNGNIDVSEIEINIHNNTRLIVLNHMSNVLGNTTDIDMATAIANAYNIPILVDTAQSLGHRNIDLDNTPIDMLACAGHKGLHGPMGSGFLVFNRDRVHIAPLMFGGTGTNSNILDMPTEYPESLEVGTLCAPAILGLGAGIKWTYDHLNDINKKVGSIANITYQYLSNNENITIYSAKDSPVLSFNVRNYSSEEVATYLNERGIAVRAGLHCAPLVHSYYGTIERGMVRVSVGYNNSEEDAYVLMDALDTITL